MSPPAAAPACVLVSSELLKGVVIFVVDGSRAATPRAAAADDFLRGLLNLGSERCVLDAECVAALREIRQAVVAARIERDCL